MLFEYKHGEDSIAFVGVVNAHAPNFSSPSFLQQQSTKRKYTSGEGEKCRSDGDCTQSMHSRQICLHYGRSKSELSHDDGGD